MIPNHKLTITLVLVHRILTSTAPQNIVLRDSYLVDFSCCLLPAADRNLGATDRIVHTSSIKPHALEKIQPHLSRLLWHVASHSPCSGGLVRVEITIRRRLVPDCFNLLTLSVCTPCCRVIWVSVHHDCHRLCHPQPGGLLRSPLWLEAELNQRGPTCTATRQRLRRQQSRRNMKKRVSDIPILTVMARLPFRTLCRRRR
mmetsp:Transcript_49206/g.129899  ORF Transcript_49206/g.129899 Transcript_49206/m.129899 type:complete len:200 (+) Transcript_49206:214-813(+)